MKTEHTNIRALKFIGSFCPSYFPLFIVKTFFEKFSPYFNLYLSAEIVNEIVGERNSKILIGLVLITVIGNFVIAMISAVLNRIVEHKTVIRENEEALYYNQKMLSLDYVDLENAEVRQLWRGIDEASRINGHGKQLLLWSAERLIGNVIRTVLALMLSIELFVLVFSSGEVIYAIVFAALIAMLILFSIWFSFQSKEKMGSMAQQVSQTMIDENRIDDAVDCYNMGKDVRLYRQDKMIMKIKNYAFDLHKKAFKLLATSQFKWRIPLLCVDILQQATTYGFICVYSIIGVFGIGSIIKYVGVVKTLTDCIICFFDTFADMKSNTPFVRDYLAFFAIPRKMYRGNEPVKVTANRKIVVEFRNVSFKYPGAETYALKNISMKFCTGERMAVVGVNGSGKTTFIKLLCRLYDPTEGEILFDGINIQKYNYDEFLSLFSVVFQDFKLFSFTLGENVAGDSAFNSEKVMRSLEQSGLGPRLSVMPNGINTPLYKDFDENGIEISGGEAQKIALARALHKDAPFIILDEPTAALDPAAEYEIYSRFNEFVESRTAIYISHRLSSCRFCRIIVVFDQGQIVQQGSHEDLLTEREGKYYELWHAQANYYTE